MKRPSIPEVLVSALVCLAPFETACGQANEYQLKIKPAVARAADSAGAPVAEGRVPNYVTIRAATHNVALPFTISRLFARGEIPHFAQAIAGSKQLKTQCDVKTRWPDGSLKHALLSFWSTVPSGGLQVSFQDAEGVEEDGFLTKDQMLASDYDFGASMELVSDGSVRNAHARTMLSNGDFRYWLKGPICTQVIIEDRSENLRYDLGWAEPASFHPIFVATFYPGWRGVKMELIGENVWTTRLRDLQYSLELRTGSPLGDQPVYSKASFTHYAGTRWRKVFWSGPEPGVESIDYNLPYLIYSQAVPNYDVTLKMPSRAVDEEWRIFQDGDRGDINGSAEWGKHFNAGGGRGDIGLLPRWYVRYLFNFGAKMQQVMLGNAAASAHVPVHFRESKPGLGYLRSSGLDAFGRVVSVDARPTIWTSRVGAEQTSAEDRIAPLQPLSEAHDWVVDDSHQGSFVYLPYLITGDWYFLEELYFWSGFNVGSADPTSDIWWGRHKDWSILFNLQTRGRAWVLRTLADTAFMAPDNTPEQDYFTEKLYYNIAVWEGFANVRDGAFHDPSPSSPWSWGRNQVGANGGPNPLQIMDLNDAYSALIDVNTDPNQVCRASRVNSPWMENYVHIVLGHIEELGFPVRRLRATVALNLLNRVVIPDYNPYLVAAYRHPVMQASTKGFYTDWKCALAAFKPELQRIETWPGGDQEDGEHGYPIIARGAASFLPGIVDPANGLQGDDAWAWFEKHLNAKAVLSENPKWAFVPRQTPAGRGAGGAQPPRGQHDRGR